MPLMISFIVSIYLRNGSKNDENQQRFLENYKEASDLLIILSLSCLMTKELFNHRNSAVSGSKYSLPKILTLYFF